MIRMRKTNNSEVKCVFIKFYSLQRMVYYSSGSWWCHFAFLFGLVNFNRKLKCKQNCEVNRFWIHDLFWLFNLKFKLYMKSLLFFFSVFTFHFCLSMSYDLFITHVLLWFFSSLILFPSFQNKSFFFLVFLFFYDNQRYFFARSRLIFWFSLLPFGKKMSSKWSLIYLFKIQIQ